MHAREEQSEVKPVANPFLTGMSAIFASLGRALVCLDRDFRIIHASASLSALLGDGAVERIVGRKADEVMGTGLFGIDGSLRRALIAGEKREGWGATIQSADNHTRLVSITVAPVTAGLPGSCDQRVAYVIVLRPGEESEEGSSSSPTVFSNMIARSSSMLQIFRLIEQLNESEATIMVTGESGTGKELVARALHAHSPRRGGPFVAVNCGALPGELLESELFGHVRGAFTGAVKDRIGRFEMASGGTIFLDEVADLPLHLQVKLLRVLQDKSFERVGESTTRTSDARVIAATNKDMRRAVLDGEFRDDLYYRLRVVPIVVPPLRKRREDIEPVARFLLSRINRRHGRTMRLAPDALGALLRYPWPGNVREMENAIEYALAVSTGQTIHVQDLPPEVLDPDSFPSPDYPREEPTARSAGRDRDEHVMLADSPERARIKLALEEHRWNRSETASALGISRSTLWRKMRELRLG